MSMDGIHETAKIVLIRKDDRVGFEVMPELKWVNAEREMDAASFICGHCGGDVATTDGYYSVPRAMEYRGFPGSHARRRVYICPKCERPSYWENGLIVFPLPKEGTARRYLPKLIEQCYEEARRAIANDAPTAAAMVLRKMLMNIGVDRGAKKDHGFAYYVEWLLDNGWVPPNAKDWVTKIKDKGNEANHEIEPVSREDASQLLYFVDHLLAMIYELPGALTPPPA